MSRLLNTEIVVDAVADIVKRACCELSDNLTDALQKALEREASPYGRETLQTLLDNAAYAKEQGMPCCQDTGSCILFVSVGQEVAWEGAPLTEQINKGVAKGYTEGYLRKSIVRDPLHRVNTQDNTPAMIHYEIVPGDRVTITAFPKGGGSENLSAFKTLIPSAGAAGIRDFVLETVKDAGGRPCPPIILGIGVGGTMDQCAFLAKKALLRPIGSRNADPDYAALEERLLREINDLGIGPMGMGGTTTALDVHIEQFACHITSLPVAISFQCNANRQATAVL